MVGIIANVDEILSPEALKATHFLNLCNRRNNPVIFLQNSSSLEARQSSGELSDSSILKSRGSLSRAIAMLTVPKLSVTLTACRGDDYLTMVRQHLIQ
jgi:3-methylcrotonyl-CoA carboxylase beta subunit